MSEYPPVAIRALIRKLASVPFPVSVGRYPQGQIAYINPAMERLLGHHLVPTRYRNRTSVELGWWTHSMERGRLLAIFNATRRLDAEETELRTADGRVLRTALSMRLLDFCEQRHTFAAFGSDPRAHQGLQQLFSECENLSGQLVASGDLTFSWQPGNQEPQVNGNIAGLIDTHSKPLTVRWRTVARCFHRSDWRALVLNAAKVMKKGISFTIAVKMRIEENPYTLHQVSLSADPAVPLGRRALRGRVEPMRSLAQAYGYGQDQNVNLELARDTAGISTWEVFADGSVIWDIATFVQYGETPGTYERPESIFRRAFSDAEHTRLQHWIKENFGRANTPGVEFQIRREGLPPRWVSARATQRRDALGQITSIKGINWDITELKNAQLRLADQRLELAKLSSKLFDQERTLSRQLCHQLHDGLGQTLTAINIQISELAKQIDAHSKGAHHVQRLVALSQQALKEIRMALAEVRPPALIEHGIAAALAQECRTLIEQFGEGQIGFYFAPETAHVRLDPDVEYTLFMVAREGIINALKHSRLSTLRLSCRCTDSPSCTVYVQDDGIGIENATTCTRGSGVGITSMRERAASIGARIEFLPLSTGTCMRIVWPG